MCVYRRLISVLKYSSVEIFIVYNTHFVELLLTTVSVGWTTLNNNNLNTKRERYAKRGVDKNGKPKDSDLPTVRFYTPEEDKDTV